MRPLLSRAVFREKKKGRTAVPLPESITDTARQPEKKERRDSQKKRGRRDVGLQERDPSHPLAVFGSGGTSPNSKKAIEKREEKKE